jgi:hypothetical protein
MTTSADPQPTPEDGSVPAAGRRLPFVLAGLAVLLAIGVAWVLSRENEAHPLDDVSAALQASAATLAGPLNVTALEHTRCAAAEGENRYTCTSVMDNAAAANAIDVEYVDGTITKRLAGSKLTSAPRAGNEVAAALAADEQATLGRTVQYGCAFSIGINADGSSASDSPGGFRCVSLKAPAGSKAPVQRYVEFAADGAVTRDFIVAAG